MSFRYSDAIVNEVLAQLEREGRGRMPSPMARIRAELARSYVKHGREQWGRHEFYGIIKEEVDEMWDAIKDDEPLEKVLTEAIQVAAMVVRYIETGDRYGFTGRPADQGAGNDGAGPAGGGQGS